MRCRLNRDDTLFASQRHNVYEAEQILAGNAYQCLKALRALLPREDRLMAARPQ